MNVMYKSKRTLHVADRKMVLDLTKSENNVQNNRVGRFLPHMDINDLKYQLLNAIRCSIVNLTENYIN